MKEFIEFIIKHLVDKPDEVQVNEIVGERNVVSSRLKIKDKVIKSFRAILLFGT